MRDIKFRGKPTDNNTSYFEDEKFAYGYLVISNDKYYILLDILDNIKRDDYAVYMVEVKPETVGQYTGLKDKNGKEIFEGDVVEVNEDIRRAFDLKKIMYVDFIEGSFLLKAEKEIKWNLLTCFPTIVDIEGKARVEKVGNIYDNPELLKKGK